MRLLTIFLMGLLLSTGQVIAGTKTTYGYIENATLVEKNLTLPAKLDTGARSSSLHAIDIKKEKRDGKTYIRFTVPYEGGKTTFVSEYFGKVNIKARTQEIEHITRPVVWMKIKLGGQEQTIRVNLTNRANFIYPLLLGRQAIVAFNGLVDPSIKYEVTTEPPHKREATNA